jgi:ABC-type transport system substrate-binding protein/DNA-binding SARP family transcriptional activator
VEYRILGVVEARRDGAVIALGGAKQRALLAILLLDANRPVSRDRLIDGLWGESPPPSASATFDTHLSRLRQALGAGDVILRQPPGYLIRVEPDELDLDHFERLVAEANRFPEAQDRSRLLGEALALWRGPALADLQSEPFATVESPRLEELRVTALEQRIDADLETGTGSSLIPELELLVRDYPLRERFAAQLMLALYRAGRQGDALAVFGSLRRRFAEELGLSPSAELGELEQRILQHDPGLGRADKRSAPTGTEARRVVRGSHGRRWLAGAAAAVALAAAASSIVVGVELGSGGSGGSSVHGSTTGVFELAGRSSIAGASLLSAPTAVVADSSSIWLAEPSAGVVVRVALSSGQVEQTVGLGGSPSMLAVGDGSVWAATDAGDSIYQIDQATERVIGHIPLPRDAHVGALAYGFGRLWVGDPTGHQLFEYNPATDHLVREFGTDVWPSALAVGAGAVWIADYDNGFVEEFDPRSGVDLGTIRVGDGPAAIAVGDGAVWVANSADNTVSRIEPASDTAGPAIPVGNDPVALAVNGGSVEVANEYGSSVMRIDPRRNTVVQTTEIGGGPTALTAAGGRIWTGTSALGAHHGGTLRLLHQRPLTLDTALQEDLPGFQSDGLTNDALLALAWVGPSQQLIPDLAYSVPIPADGGTRYTFRVRPAHYSDGRLVQPKDFRRAIERLFRVGAGWSVLFTDIVGANACTKTRCDLSHGIVVNEAHRTITFRLSRPDPAFLANMTSIGTAPVPPGTPFHNVRFTPIPGTGPYLVASADKHEIRYVRNPRFVEWSHAAQPDGNPDVIIMRFGLSPAQEVKEVEENKADWSADSVPGNLLPDVMRRFPGQLHSLNVAETDWLQLNTTVPPFDDLRVRTALNLAIDRAAIDRMYGGRLTATPTCQLLPPSLPGYQPYCPYTRRPGNGHWHAPDLARARVLVAASGTRGEHISADGWVGGGPGCSTVIRYTVQVLRELGYRAQAHFVSLSPKIRFSALQMACTGEEDFQPTDLFGSFGCSSTSDNQWFCDPRFDAEVQRAQALAESDPRAEEALLTKLDRELTDRAVFVPLVNRHFYDFVSARVKNYVKDPQFGLVVDQASLR